MSGAWNMDGTVTFTSSTNSTVTVCCWFMTLDISVHGYCCWCCHNRHCRYHHHHHFSVIVIIISIIINNNNKFTQFIYNYTPEKNKQTMFWKYMVLQFSATIYLQFMLQVKLFPMLNVLYFCISTFQRMCAVPSRVGICSSLISCFLRMLFRYFLNDSKMIQSASIITGITSVFLLYSLYILPSSHLLTWLHFCLPKLQHLLT